MWDEEKRDSKAFNIALGNGKKWTIRAAGNTTLDAVWNFIKPAVPHGIFAVIQDEKGNQKQYLRGVD